MDRIFTATALILVNLVCSFSQAELSIIDVRKNIPLSDEEPSYTDYYLNGGEGDGLKKNLVVTVFRQLNIRDNNGAQSFGEIQVPVAQVKILAVYPKISVAREYKLLSRDENPMLEQVGIMSGDKINTTGSFVDTSKPKRKPQTAALAPAVAPTPAAPAKVTVISATQVTPPEVSTGPTVTATPIPSTVTEIPKTPVEPSDGVPEALLENPVNNTANPVQADSGSSVTK